MSFDWRLTDIGIFFSLILIGVCLKVAPSTFRDLSLLTAFMIFSVLFVLWFGLFMMLVDKIEKKRAIREKRNYIFTAADLPGRFRLFFFAYV